MGLGDFISNVVGGKNEFEAKQTELDQNAYEYGGQKGGAQQAANAYGQQAANAQGKAGEYGAQQQNLYNRGNNGLDMAGQAFNQGQNQMNVANNILAQQGQARQGQQDVANMMMARARGETPSIAQMQGDRAAQQMAAQQSSAAASARGGAAMALAQQNAANNLSTGQANIAQQTQINAANERMQAEQSALGAYGQMRGGDVSAANTAFGGAQTAYGGASAATGMANSAFGAGAQSGQLGLGQGQLGLGYAGLQNNVNQTQLNAQQNKMAQQSNNQNAANQINAAVAQQNAAAAGQAGMGAMGAGASLAGAAATSSDARAKQGIRPVNDAEAARLSGRADEIMGGYRADPALARAQGAADGARDAGIGGFLARQTSAMPSPITGYGMTQDQFDAYRAAQASDRNHLGQVARSERDEQAASPNATIGGGFAVPGMSYAGQRAPVTKDAMYRADDKGGSTEESRLASLRAYRENGVELSDRDKYDLDRMERSQGKAAKNEKEPPKGEEKKKLGIGDVLSTVGKSMSDTGDRMGRIQFGGGGGGEGVHLLGSPTYTPAPISFRAEGGPVMAGQPTIVGEAGPEAFVPSGGGNGEVGSKIAQGSMGMDPSQMMTRAQGVMPHGPRMDAGGPFGAASYEVTKNGGEDVMATGKAMSDFDTRFARNPVAQASAGSKGVSYTGTTSDERAKRDAYLLGRAHQVAFDKTGDQQWSYGGPPKTGEEIADADPWFGRSVPPGEKERNTYEPAERRPLVIARGAETAPGKTASYPTKGGEFIDARGASGEVIDARGKPSEQVAEAPKTDEGLLSKLRSAGKSALAYVGARAEGGAVESGKPYMVGEKGPELIVPKQSGTVVPNSALPLYEPEGKQLRIDEGGRGFYSDQANKLGLPKLEGSDGGAREPKPTLAKAKAPPVEHKMSDDEMMRWADAQIAQTNAAKDRELAAGSATQNVEAGGGPAWLQQYMTSDERAKRVMKEEAPMASANRAQQGYSYEYKPEFAGREGQAPGEKNVGPMAQNLAANPVARTAVKKGEDGLLELDLTKLSKLHSAGIASLQDQVDALARVLRKRGE